MKWKVAILFVVSLASPTLAKAATITVYAPSVWNANAAVMDAALGISGFAIEDFEDTTLIHGLQVQFSSPDAGPYTTLPAVDSLGRAWDGVGTLRNRNFAALTTFLLPSGTTSFGVGLTEFEFPQASHELLINGVSVGLIDSLTNFETPFFAGLAPRNGYLRIDAEAGETLSSIAFRVIGPDTIVFDHVAIGSEPVPPASVPEPTSLLLLSAGLAGFAVRRLRVRN